MKIKYKKIDKRAKKLALGDCIKVGTLKYEIVGVRKNNFGKIMIELSTIVKQAPFERNPKNHATLILPKNTIVTTLM
jgi:hypothetical protein